MSPRHRRGERELTRNVVDAARDQNADARRSGWLQGHISKQAARDPIKADQARRALLTAAERHLTFADLFSGRGARAVPTRDISVMWCADLLRRARGVFFFFESGVRHRREVEATTTGRQRHDEKIPQSTQAAEFDRRPPGGPHQ